MRPGRRSTSLLLATGLLAATTASVQAEMGAQYLNNYGSGWGVWIRGHSTLRETEQDYVLEVERISIEPNRAYPQNFEISGFKLAYYFKDKESGEPLDESSVSGTSAPYPAKLHPSQPLVVENMTVSVTKPTQADFAQALVLELHVVTASGVSIGVKVSELFEP
ncbi:hypothetical protein [Denitrobaculum tricleocarpae]|uniref:Uncharacterized protein n=1 Tax=Denitrobaculum tricleocarpae TaxID=2591009 RepID=A0A545TG46_9PROT|nr:hypothetical protein [Denitrobaculum tricleocarpae]TQV76175.1 hypothetical protein FKG95_21270 [Denitrobaculum tricleocarpae]